jgi:hypothetical protein
MNEEEERLLKCLEEEYPPLNGHELTDAINDFLFTMDINCMLSYEHENENKPVETKEKENKN